MSAQSPEWNKTNANESRLVCRLWILKSAILEFFKRLNANWQRSYGLALLAIRCTLIATFVAVIVADLAECRPFFHYWQVLPDPGPQCRQGFAQLITMATCNVFTDLLLVFFPIPIIIQSQMGLRRKIQLVLLFSLSLGPVAITLYRVPHIVWDHGSQQSRSLYASVEILFATVAANALVLGSFVRDRGVKKQKFKYGSVAAGSMERSSGSYSRRPTAMRHWGSDVDLVRDVGFGVDRDLQEVPNTPDKLRQFSYAPAPAARLQDMRQWDFPSHKRASVAPSDDSYLSSHAPATRSNSTASPTRKVSFFDVGGLLEEDAGLEEEEDMGPTAAPRPPRVVPASTSGFRRGSSMVLQDVGGLLSVRPKSLRTGSATPSEIQSNKQGARGPPSPRETTTSLPIYDQFANQSEPELKDPGGLLG